MGSGKIRDGEFIGLGTRQSAVGGRRNIFSKENDGARTIFEQNRRGEDIFVDNMMGQGLFLKIMTGTIGENTIGEGRFYENKNNRVGTVLDKSIDKAGIFLERKMTGRRLFLEKKLRAGDFL